MSFLLCCCVKRSASPDEAEKAAKESAACNDEEIEIPRMDDEGDFEIDCDDAEGNEIVNGNNDYYKQFPNYNVNAKYNPNRPYCFRCCEYHDLRMIGLQPHYLTGNPEIYQEQISRLPAIILSALNRMRGKKLELDEHLQQRAASLWSWQATQVARFRDFSYNGVTCDCKEKAVHGAIAYRIGPLQARCIMKDALKIMVLHMLTYWARAGPSYMYRPRNSDTGPGFEDYKLCCQYTRYMIHDETAERCGLRVGVLHAELGDLFIGGSLGKKPEFIIGVVLVLDNNKGNPNSYEYNESDSD